MASGPRTEREVYWRGQFLRWEKSGLTQVEYCRKNDLKKATFGWWLRKVRALDSDSIAPQKFVAVEIQDTTDRSCAAAPIEIDVAGHVIRVRSGFESSVLKQVISTLEESSC